MEPSDHRVSERAVDGSLRPDEGSGRAGAAPPAPAYGALPTSSWSIARSARTSAGRLLVPAGGGGEVIALAPPAGVGGADRQVGASVVACPKKSPSGTQPAVVGHRLTARAGPSAATTPGWTVSQMRGTTPGPLTSASVAVAAGSITMLGATFQPTPRPRAAFRPVPVIAIPHRPGAPVGFSALPCTGAVTVSPEFRGGLARGSIQRRPGTVGRGVPGRWRRGAPVPARTSA